MSFDGRIRGDSRQLPLADESVQCVITSPPYYGLRDYGTGTWESGEKNCEHRSPTMRKGREEKMPMLDPFAGSGTVAMVAEQHGRKGISIDLGYQDLQGKRLKNLQKLLNYA